MSVRDKDIPSSSRKSLTYRGKLCLNCSTPLDISDRFCHNCGQRNSTKRLTAFDYFNEFLMSVITFDSRIFYTINDLFFEPGTISRNYIAGKRAKYANPFRFFLSVSIIFFLFSSFLDYFKPDDSEPKFNLFSNTETITPSLNYNTAENDTLKIDQNIELDEDDAYDYITPQNLDTLTFFNKHARKGLLFYQFFEASGIADPGQAMDSLHYNKSKYNLWLYSKNKMIGQVKENPKAFTDYIRAKVPFFLFFFTPVFSLFFLFIYFRWYPFKVVKRSVWNSKQKTIYFMVHQTRFGTIVGIILSRIYWLFIVRRSVNYMEHMIFNFHTLIFFFLGFLLCLLPDFLLGFNLFSGLFLAICPLYFYKAMRNFYRESRIVTIVKLITINFVFLMLGGIIAAFFFTAWAAIY